MCEGLTGIAPRAAGAHRVTSLTSRGFERRRGAHLWREVSIPGYRVHGIDYMVQGTGYMLQGTGYRVRGTGRGGRSRSQGVWASSRGKQGRPTP